MVLDVLMPRIDELQVCRRLRGAGERVPILMLTARDAVGNLLDNAEKWSPRDAPVEVRVAAGEVAVRDHGPGIADEDLPFVFDRFYRAPAARGLPGSGRGLAIVRQVAEAHGAAVTAERAEGGGAVLRVSFEPLPSAAATAPPRSAAPSG